jgi:hypothetical protein
VAQEGGVFSHVFCIPRPRAPVPLWARQRIRFFEVRRFELWTSGTESANLGTDSRCDSYG